MDPIKLICFDLDQTLITHSSWKELGLALGISYEQDKRLFKEYESGITTYEQWNAKVLELYMKHPDANRERITEILSRYSYAKGAREAIEYLKEKGYILVLISGSIDILVDIVARDLGIKYAQANNALVFDEDGRLEGIHSLSEDEVFGKAEHLEAFSRMLGIPLTQCACVADGANDIEMFRRTGHGVTFKGSPIERQAWNVIDSFDDLRNIF
jgi:phosphoserine phosphatase